MRRPEQVYDCFSWRWILKIHERRKIRRTERLGCSAGAQGGGNQADEVAAANLHLCGLTFELSGRQRQATKPGPVKMYRVPPARAWWPAVGAPLERGVRHQCASLARRVAFCMRTILLPAQRHRKSSRGTPRLRRMPREEQGARALRGQQQTRILALTFQLIVRAAIACLPYS